MATLLAAAGRGGACIKSLPFGLSRSSSSLVCTSPVLSIIIRGEMERIEMIVFLFGPVAEMGCGDGCRDWVGYEVFIHA